MKQLFYFSIILLLMNCSKKSEENSKSQNYLKENIFILSSYEKHFDSLENVYSKTDSIQILKFDEDKYFNPNYSMGAIHFLIVDQKESYYIINDLSPFLKNWCGWENTDKKSISNDSILLIKRNIEKINHAKLINNNEIIKILTKYKDSIIHTYNSYPLTISFAFRNDTLKGSTMFNTINYMESNGMNLYFMRKMNIEELNKVKK
ncbi:hypothetical protein [Soonwooa purpurea]